MIPALVETMKKVLKARGMTYADLALALHVSTATVKRQFSQRTFTLERLEEILKVLEIDFYELARMSHPKRRGWFNYYGRFTPSALRPIERHVGQSLVRWACRKYKKLRNHRSREIGRAHV